MADVAQFNFWKKHQTQLFLRTAGTADLPTWSRLGLSTVLDIAMNTESEDYDFIKDENPTTIVEKYAPSLAQEHMAKEGDSCFEYLWSLFYNMEYGTAVETEALIVFPKAGSGNNSFQAWKMPATIVLNNFDFVAKKINFDIKTAGTIEKGTAVVTDGAPVFTAASTTTAQA